MKKLGTFLLLIIVIVVAIYISSWVSAEEAKKEAFYARLLNQRTTSLGISDALIMALWLNDNTAYDVTDPSVWDRVDEWMANHIIEECSIFDSGQLDGVSGEGSPSFLQFSCDAGTLTLYDIKTKHDESGRLVITDWSFEKATE